MREQRETVVIGGGQAGLALSRHLCDLRRDHVVLEQASRPAHVWLDRRWDSFTLVTPNGHQRMPGAEYRGDAPDGFMSRAELGAFFEDYVRRFGLPLRCGVRVTAVEPSPSGSGYRVYSEDGEFEATNVVVATGLFQHPKIPQAGSALPDAIVQMHSSEYRSPDTLPPGAVLVVGSAQSGCQIAEELHGSGRTVYLSTGSAGRIPRRYRGREIFRWLDEIGFFDRTASALPSPAARFAANPHLSGKDGGHTINLHRFARDGIVLLGHMRGIGEGTVRFETDLKENLAASDKVEGDLCAAIDRYIVQSAPGAPEEDLPHLRDGYALEAIGELDVKKAGITSVIWATGYSFDFSLVKLPVTDRYGYPVQERGASVYPGLYFLGFPWLHNAKSGLLCGVGDDAAFLSARIAA